MQTLLSALGAVLAMTGVVLLAFGAQRQHRGVQEVREAAGSSTRGTLRLGLAATLPRNPTWVRGVLLTGLGIAFNLVSLRLAPLIVVQPLGVFAIVVAAMLDARAGGYRLRRPAVTAIAVIVLAVGVFVLVATLTAENRSVSDDDLARILTALAVAVPPLVLLIVVLGRRFPAITNVTVAGVLAGFVVTLAKAVLTRATLGVFDPTTVLAAAVLLLLCGASVYFAQRSFASGPLHLVVAGLTVVDPLVAVGLGVVVLQETASTPWWAVVVYLASGAVAALGILLLARSAPSITVGGPAAPAPGEPANRAEAG